MPPERRLRAREHPYQEIQLTSNRYLCIALACLLVVCVSLDIYMGITQDLLSRADLAWGLAGVSAVPPIALRAAMALGVLLLVIDVFGRLGSALPGSAP